MKNIFLSVVLFLSIFAFYTTTFAQSNRFLQFDMHGGISSPVQDFKNLHMFAGRGYAAGAGFDYFFGRIGLGISSGYFTNASGVDFADYIEHKYYERPGLTGFKDWNTRFILFGPTLKLGGKKLELDIFAKIGSSQIAVPDLLFTKTFFGQSYEVYRFSGVSKDWQFAWSAGTRLLYRVNHWFGIQAKADYFTTSYLSNVLYDNTFRDAYDGNRNGVMEDVEYFESQKISDKGTANLSVVNLNFGLILHLGRKKENNVVKMLPEVPETQPERTDNIAVAEKKLEVSESSVPAKVDIPVMPEKTVPQTPVVNAQEAPMVVDDIETEPEAVGIVIPPTTYDAPESKYDEEAAEFLYKAGESYFATNEFENALPCFNKLKADPKYPRAKYMFALSLCSMGNCTEAKKEYKEFAKTYKESDARTLEIIFASHIERCATSGKLIPKSEEKVQVKQSSKDKEYKIQFIAIKKPNARFPGLESVGTVSTEFFPNKSVYRYTLVGYNDIKEAADNVYKVRKMGFRDAFVAVYENGVRVNTLYHAK